MSAENIFNESGNTEGSEEILDPSYIINSWDDLDLNHNILRGIYAYGFEKPSPIQQKAIKPIICGKDIIAQAQSGTGKTGAFSVGVLQNIDAALTLPSIAGIVLTMGMAIDANVLVFERIREEFKNILPSIERLEDELNTIENEEDK